MSKKSFKAFLKRKDIEFSAKRYGIDALGAMAQGLFASLLIGTILSQATAGTKSIAINFTASYVLSKRITLQAYFDHQINKPLISSSAYPTTNSNYGVSVNLSLAQ